MEFYIENIIPNGEFNSTGGIACTVMAETDKAYLFADDYGNEDWVAKSIIEEGDEVEGQVFATVADWFVYKTCLGNKSKADWVNKRCYRK